MMAKRPHSGTQRRAGDRARVAAPPSALLFAAALALLPCQGARAEEGAGPETLRLCADPTNPPFSSNNPNNPGMYLELGAAIAQKLGRPSEPVWELTYFGKHAVKDTLLSGKCDMTVGLPPTEDFMGRRVIFTKPFMQVGFAFAAPAGGLPPRLAALHGHRKVAVQLATPPQSLLANYDDIDMATFLNPEDAMQALADRKVEAAFVWGPSAGYVNHAKYKDAFTVTPVAGTNMQFPVGIGFAAKNAALRDQVDAALAGMGSTVAALAAKYGFPLAQPVQMAWAPIVPEFSYASFRPSVAAPRGRLPILRVAATEQTTEDQQSAADFVAPNRGPADANFKPASAPTAVAEGRTLFNSTCNHCHGPDAVQAVKKINLRLLQHRYGGAMDQVFHYTVTHGRESKGMPNWSGVFTEDDFSKMLAFLHSVQEP